MIPGFRDLRIVERSIASLAVRRNNPRTHSERQIRQIAASIETFGFVNPVLIDASGTIVAGHGRARAAKQLGMTTVPTIQLEHLTDAQVRGFVIADNRLAECAGWDRDLLALELQGLAEIELDFDLEVLGFETVELDLLIGEAAAGDESDPADVIGASDPNAPVVSRIGDFWRIGPHRLLCANALDAAAYSRLLNSQKAQMIFTDPPYNVRVDGHVSGLGRRRHTEFAMASGEMSAPEFASFLATALGHHAAHSTEGALHFVCMDWRHVGELLQASKAVYREVKNLCVWVKSNAGMGSLYRSQHELVFVFKVGSTPHVNNVELGRHGRSRSNVWRYAGVNTFGATRDEALAMHPTVKPVRMVADAILDCSRKGDRVLDGFAGAGTTLLAAERTGRVGFGLEIEPRYVDATLRRLAEHAGLEAIHVETGRTFAEVEGQRASEAHGDTAKEVES
ncbi:ParB N-terminal domain-containing protein [Myxococcota bacterium]|nr:ParB N-terminal domain-containing protein [Myxococcota bacterium]